MIYMNDGQNLFDGTTSFSGKAWQAQHAFWSAMSEDESESLPPFVIVGIDHAGPLRSYDYLPVVPGTGKGGFRPEAAKWPGGGIDAYLTGMMDVIFPATRAHFNLSSDPDRIALGGSSFGGIAVLHAMLSSNHPISATFSKALIESPSLWIDQGRYLEDFLLPRIEEDGSLPNRRVYVAMGAHEHSGTRGGPDAGVDAFAADEGHVESFNLLLQALRQRFPANQVCVVDQNSSTESPTSFNSHRLFAMLDPQGSHNEADWGRRLPTAFRFLFSDVSGTTLVPPEPTKLRARGLRAAKAASVAPPDPAFAHQSSGSLYYTSPRELVSGVPFTFYFNRRVSTAGLAHRPNVKLHYGFNGWTLANAEFPVALSPASDINKAPGLGGLDWWWGRVEEPVPEGATEMNFVFSDGDGENALWDNNNGSDYSVPVVEPEEYCTLIKSLEEEEDEEDEEEEEEEVENRNRSKKSLLVVREIAKQEQHALAGGTLHIITLAPRAGKSQTAAEARAARWQEEKILRVWVPNGCEPSVPPPPGGYPVLYMSDAQNLFEDWMAHQGVCWKAAETAAHLIGSGQLPPFIIVGIDAVGAFRSLNFLPFPPGVGIWGFRPECARWPGGGLDKYVGRVVTEILPFAEKHFGASPLRERRVFGGASFAGVAALHMGLKYSDVFGGILAESPSLWSGEGRYLEIMSAHAEGKVAERFWLGSGTREYSATREFENLDVDALLSHYHNEAARILDEKGVRDGRLKYQVDEGAGHHEGAWAWRLSAALIHLFHGRM